MMPPTFAVPLADAPHASDKPAAASPSTGNARGVSTALLRRTRARGAALASAALVVALTLSACGGPPKARLEEQRAQQEFAARGYRTANEPISVRTQQWRLKNDVYRLTLAIGTSYSGAAPRPVVVYLPGLGESENAGLKWRQAWAAAGYAVLSVQPLDTDAQAWSSELARAAEFKKLGLEHYAEPMLRQRLSTLDTLLGEARRRSESTDPLWRALDWTRVAVAGFDLGAQAALTVAGEALSDGSVVRLRHLRPQAVVVISPQIMAAPQAAQYQAIQVPVLGLTGPGDHDVIGLVQTRWRTVPFDGIPSDKSWLLSLPGITHTALAGNETPVQETPDRRNDMADSGGGRRGMGGGMGGGMMMAPVPYQPDWRALHEAQLGFIAAQQTSVAFLDLQLKQSDQARAWLAGSAAEWLGKNGKLKAPL